MPKSYFDPEYNEEIPANEEQFQEDRHTWISRDPLYREISNRLDEILDKDNKGNLDDY